MSAKFHKFKLLLDENMSARRKYGLLNSLFDVKHLAFDLKKGGLRDEQVHKEAAKMQRLIITFNGKDFRTLATTSDETGVIFGYHTESCVTMYYENLLNSVQAWFPGFSAV